MTCPHCGQPNARAVSGAIDLARAPDRADAITETLRAAGRRAATVEIVHAVIAGMREHGVPSIAAETAGIRRQTLAEWRMHCPELDALCLALDASHSRRYVATVDKVASDPDHRDGAKMAAWMLERRRPDEFSPRQTVRVESEPEDDDAWQALEEMLAAPSDRVIGVLHDLGYSRHGMPLLVEASGDHEND